MLEGLVPVHYVWERSVEQLKRWSSWCLQFFELHLQLGTRAMVQKAKATDYQSQHGLHMQAAEFEVQDTNTRNSEYHVSLILLIRALDTVAENPTLDEVSTLLRWLSVNTTGCSAAQAEQKLSSSIFELRAE